MSKEMVLYEYDELPEITYDGKYRKVDIELIKYIANRVRKTIEYKNFIDYMKRTLKINHCSFYKDYSMDSGYTIELHHAPLTLFDYCEAIANKEFDSNKDPQGNFLYPWKVEEEVNILHYNFMVGLVPLNPSAHELVHSGALIIHNRMVEGNWGSFMREYSQYISQDTKDKIEIHEEYSKTDPDKIPDLIKYKPAMISNLKFKSLGDIDIQNILIDKLKDRFNKSQNLIESDKK